MITADLLTSTPAIAVLTALTLITAKTIWNSTGPHAKNGFPRLTWNWPIIGHTFELVRAGKDFYPRITNGGKNKLVNISLLGLDCLAVLDPEVVKQILVKGYGTFTSTLWFPRWVELFGPKAITTVDYIPGHKRLRFLLGQSVTNEALALCYPQLRENARLLISHMVTANHEVRVYDTSKPFTYNSILFVLFGSRQQDVARMQRQYDNFQAWTAGMMDFFIPVWMNGPFAKALQAKQDISDALMELISERRVLKEVEGGEEDGFSKLLFGKNEDGEALSDEEVVENVIMMVFAGHDTTAGAISSAVHCWVYEMVDEEREMLLDEIMAADVTSDAVLNKLPVLDAFVKEVMRFQAPIGGVIRQFSADTVVNGKLVPKGSAINVCLRTLGFNPDVFPEPEVFKISRFLDTSLEERGKQAYSYVPFGVGPRMCLGKALAKIEVKIFLYELISAHTVMKGDKPSAKGSGAVAFMNPSVTVVPLHEA
ncbi:hypothetical protein HDU98_007426 [Podochytrium sp. JEL0797]|nr:hypothetical protein HDU98_007426 [Podochytrium sp. JEL0797]